MKKILVAVPSGELVHAEFMVSVSAMLAISFQKGLPVVLANRQRTRIEINRYGLTLLAKEMEASHILFVDSDMTFPPDMLFRLLEADKDIIGCNCAKRMVPTTMTAKLYPQHEMKGVAPVVRLGLGVMLINMKVFERMEAPYFMAVWNEESGTFTGEDYYFCDEAYKAGFATHCDHELSKEIGHLGSRKFMLADCEDYDG